MLTEVFGGAFNPPHVGHAMIVSWIIMTGQAERVILVPAADHPFQKKMAPFQTRLTYCHALVKDIGLARGRVLVSNVETGLPTPTTPSTCSAALRRSSPAPRFGLSWGRTTSLDGPTGSTSTASSGSTTPSSSTGQASSSPMRGSKSCRPCSPGCPPRREAGLPVDHLVSRHVLQLMEPAPPGR